MSKAQQKLLDSIKLAAQQTGREFVSRDAVAKFHGSIPLVNTWNALIRSGLTVRNPAVSWSEVKAS